MTTAKTDDAKDKAAGKHIPDAPQGEDAKASKVEAGQADDAPDGSPGSSDPEAPNYAFEPQGANTDVDRTDVDQGAGAHEDDDAEDGASWVDEQVALGRRIAVSTSGEGSTITYEEIVPSNATNAQVAQAKARLRKRLVAE